jgi:tetratricopeptide (TPR) repeat protein
MKPTALIVVSLVLAAAAGAGAAWLVVPPGQAQAQAGEAELGERVTALTDALRGLQTRQDEIARDVAELRDEPAPLTAASSRVEVEDLEARVAAAVERALVAQGLEAAATRSAAARTAATLDGVDLATLPLGDLMEMVDGVEWSDKGLELWRKLAEAGRIDEVVAAFEELADAEPSNPDRQVDLARAYLHKLFSLGNTPEAGIWAEKVDETYDKALALDSEHWEARFSKAVSLSHWPAFLGKTNEAIHQFEILREQQEQGSAELEYAETYLYLGNMYMQTGEKEKALEAWKAGLARFPDDEALRDQVELAGG